MIVCGIDPGYDRCGYAFLELNNGKINVLSYGLISTDKKNDFSSRIKELGDDFELLLNTYQPSHIYLETLYMGRNTTTVLGVAETRGIFRYISKKHNLTIAELSPNSIKKTISGYGAAGKSQMIQAITKLLNLPKPPYPDDTADALAIAFCGCLKIS
ncbi:MAG: crossover junction endodeoxyribonuclease RuvC [Brevinemataceae bacterium]